MLYYLLKLRLVLIFVFTSTAILTAQTADLTLNITGMETDKGTIEVGIYDNEEAFPKVGKEWKVLSLSIDSNRVIYTIQDMPHGEYAVAIYHDVNEDGKCNSNWIGIPKESFGFSNNVRPKLSAPSFNKTKFLLNEDIEILLILDTY